MSSGVRTHGANCERRSANTRMMALLSKEPFVIFQMIGSSRLGLTPRTYCGATAASSTTTPAAFALTYKDAAATSSALAAAMRARAAISSSSAAKPMAIRKNLPVRASRALPFYGYPRGESRHHNLEETRVFS